MSKSNAKRMDKKTILKMTHLAILAAIIVVLQIFCTVLTSMTGFVPITLALVPILVGAALYGKAAGAFLGTVFGIIVLCIDPTAHFLIGLDKGSTFLNIVLTIILCIGKGAAAGFVSGLMYEIFSKKSKLAGVISAGVLSPIVNTGIFVSGMLIFFNSTINEWQVGFALNNPDKPATMIAYIIFGLCGINFLIELLVNSILVPAIVRIINVSTNKKGKD